ncbi:glycine betaine ABC transporter substrate-binding protein [Paenibacillus sp. 481]|uniref:glycine betaine ABC transporter substrate-binding protein n=1 Tax=Paenibacillus sp. 481 TaxID=2835869 RepID=UPI001E3844EA|nr:glycine betaine ABC transporter substrate-binding protein [Paenibacillus sp. 481]UHA72118.1 osmoprotectant ABC transporter substrate-binding protein [Paenibacillus sp. 481]
MKRRLLSASLATVLLALTVLLSACGADNRIVIGTQTFTETKILAEMYKALIEDRTDLEAKVVPDLASSGLVLNAIKKGELQLGTLYSGEIFNKHFPIKETKDRAEVLKQAQVGFDKHFNLKWFDPLGFENTYAFTVRQDIAEQKGYTSISDIQPDANTLRLGVDTTWLERDTDGYRSFQKAYGFAFAKEFPMEQSLVYQAVAGNQVDIVLAYSTDSRLKAYNLKTLADDKKFFPPYDASPVMRKEVLDSHPQLAEIIGLLVGRLDVETMINLNYEVDIEKKSEREVALNYLKKVGLLKEG